MNGVNGAVVVENSTSVRVPRRNEGCRMMCRKKRGIRGKIGTRTGVLREEEEREEAKREVGPIFPSS